MFSWNRVGGRVRTFTGEQLRRIAFPLGGIGTGTISLGGRGNLCDWEIFNRPGKGRHLPYTFFAIRTQMEGVEPVARVLERQILPPYDTGFGLPTGLVSGLPRMREVEFTGAYPAARLRFLDATVPLDVQLEAFNPFIPMNDRDSGIPCALFVWRLRNNSRARADVSVCLSMLNACGLDGSEAPGNRRHTQLGHNLNVVRSEPGVTGIFMSSSKYPEDHPQAGTMAMAALWDDVTWQTRWERAGWWDDVQSFWDAFCATGRLVNGPEPEPSPDGESDVGSLAALVQLDPGESVEIPFLITWRFPNLVNYWSQEEAVRGRRLGTWYATQWSDAWDVARYVADELPRLAEETDAFVCCFFDSTLPGEVLDAASANVSTIRTTTCLRTEDGRFHAFEGCGDNWGCCPMNCTHVWNYEQALAFLFPSLERTMRETDFGHNVRADGSMAFRTLLPLIGETWNFKPAADGQMGTVLKLYREWLQSGDREFLARLWPMARKTIEYAWQPGSWDADQDGVMEGEQHNTYDIEFYGPNTMMGTLYLGALRAAEEMARVLGEDAFAGRCRAVFASGRAKHAALLWNGEYFRQIVLKPGTGIDADGLEPNAEDYPKYQYGAGCLSDQMLGQWFARVVGLGDLLPKELVQKAISSVHANNFRRDLSSHHSVQRVYAVNDEGGLLLCTWPHGGRPAYPFPYADEVWTGIEYQVAAHLIYEGFLEEGLEIVRAVRSRHDGAKRNPWNEPECGHHYARAMSSWSLLLALTGYHYDAARGFLRLKPVVERGCRAYFSAGRGWGDFEVTEGRQRFRTAVRLRWGELELRSLEVPLRNPGSCQAWLNEEPVPLSVESPAIRFAGKVRMEPGDVLLVAG